MRIAINCWPTSPRDGGAHTFTEQVLTSIGELAASTSHDLFLISHRKHSDESPRTGFKSEISVGQHRLQATLSRLVHSFGLSVRWILGRNPFENVLLVNRLLKQLEIDFVVNLGPFVLGNMDIPYALVVWDLEHRRLPFFPELSAQGQWASRDGFYHTALGRASIVITGTQCGREQIERFYRIDRSRIEIIPHPTPQLSGVLPAEDNQVLEKYGLRNRRYLLYPAQFWPHKNHATLVRAFSKVRFEESYNDLQLVFTGSDKGNRNFIDALVKELGIASSVHFLNVVPVEHMGSLYRNASAMVYPSFGGPENLPPLESFLFECPVIAANIPGSEEQLGDAALRVDPIDSNAWAQAIRDIVSDHSLRRLLVERGRERALERTPTFFVTHLFECLDRFSSLRATWSSRIKLNERTENRSSSVE